jgi:hypothetical protein
MTVPSRDDPQLKLDWADHMQVEIAGMRVLILGTLFSKPSATAACCATKTVQTVISRLLLCHVVVAVITRSSGCGRPDMCFDCFFTLKKLIQLPVIELVLHLHEFTHVQGQSLPYCCSTTVS